MDIPGQGHVDVAIRAAFGASDPGSARLLVSGPAVFARQAAAVIRRDIERLSVVSTLLVAGVLVWRFRSPLVLATVAIPVLLSLDMAVLVVRAVFGTVHGVAFGFGMTMLGVTLDYPVLLIGHRAPGEAASGTLGRIGRALRLAVLTAAVGLTGMVASGFPGLAQLGVFSVVGILTAAGVTLWVLPWLIVRGDLALAPLADPSGVLRVERWRRFAGWAFVPVGLSVLVLLVWPPHREGDLAALSPVPREVRDLDTVLRQELGAPDPGRVAIVQGAHAEDVLEAEEALRPALMRLVTGGALRGVDMAADIVPSLAVQRVRQAALPEGEVLSARVRAALVGLPFRADAFVPFERDVAMARGMALVRPEDVRTPVLATRLRPLLFARDGVWFGVLIPEGGRDQAAADAAFRAVPGVMLLDMKAEANALVTRTTRQAWHWLGYGAVVAFGLLALGLRDAVRLGRVVVAVAGAVVVTLAVLALLGVRVSLIHVVSLQFVTGVGLDYALFFARPQLDAAERARTLRTLVACHIMTLLTFGLLAFCRTPILHQIGMTVAIGAVCAMVLSFLLAAPSDS